MISKLDPASNDLGSVILHPGSWIHDSRSMIKDLDSWIVGPGCRVWDAESWWVLYPESSIRYCSRPFQTPSEYLGGHFGTKSSQQAIHEVLPSYASNTEYLASGNVNIFFCYHRCCRNGVSLVTQHTGCTLMAAMDLVGCVAHIFF